MTAPYVPVLHDAWGTAASEEDTLVQARFVAATLEDCGFRTTIVALGPQPEQSLRSLVATRPRVVFNLVESLQGSGRKAHWVARAMERLDLPFTGAPAIAMAQTNSKLTCKRILHQQGLPTPAWSTGVWPVDQANDLVLVKSVWEHGSWGMDENALVPAGRAAAEIRRRQERFGGRFFAEAYIAGREFNLAFLETDQGVQAFPPAEMVFVDYPDGKPHMLGYDDKWDDSSFGSRHTQRRFDFPGHDQPLLERMTGLGRQVWAVFDLKGYVRVDFRVDGDGEPWIIDINVNPCLAPDAGFMAAAVRQGYTAGPLLERILRSARPSSPDVDGWG
ncbi:MAG: D-alanine--D-alanine ligase [Magnetococcales bacterium]|nr:D-alanine--D-alanine ligase [Magnetococcales bacterium]